MHNKSGTAEGRAKLKEFVNKVNKEKHTAYWMADRNTRSVRGCSAVCKTLYNYGADNDDAW